MSSSIFKDSVPGLERSRDERLAELARDVVGAAYLRGDFVLSSGARSSFYFDKYLFETKPGVLRRVAAFLAELIPPQAQRIAGPELGAVALAAAVSLETGLPFVIVKKDAKSYGRDKLVEGELYSSDKVVLIEDVVSTATQAIRAAQQINRAGGEVLAILAVIDREQGGAENIAAAGYQFRPLFGKADVDL